MAFARESMAWSGTLRGGGQTANCRVTALRVALLGTNLFKDCLYTVLWVSKPLPDGTYKLSIDDKTIDMHNSKGNWRAAEV
jgi:hypothetical protein